MVMESDQTLRNFSGMGRFTDNAKAVVISAHEFAKKNNNIEILPIHVFLGLLANLTNLTKQIFTQANIDVESTKQQMESVLDALPKHQAAEEGKKDEVDPEFSERAKKLINDSFLIAGNLSHVYVGSEHLLLALLELKESEFVQELYDLGLTPEAVQKSISSIGNYWPGILSQTDNGGSRDDEDDRNGNLGDSSLPFFCRNMNEQSENGEFLEITGRDQEIERLIHILSRKTKNNPILVGDAGVGKTAVVQGLVQKILRGEVPSSFINKEILTLDIASMLAGAKVRGDLEERIINLVNDVMEDGEKIIFIDEIHMIVGAGGQGGRDAMDIANILKPYLTDSRLSIIGATTIEEFRRYFDDDAALSRRFQKVDIEEIDKESARHILNTLKPEFEKYHGVKITRGALDATIDLSSKFILDRYLPDKAIDLLDEAAASVKIGMEIQIEPQLSALGSKLLDAQAQKEEAIAHNNLSEAYAFKQKEDELSDEIADLIEGRHEDSVKTKRVTEELIRRVVVNQTKIPIAAASLDNSKLKDLHKKIRNQIVGQDHVLDRVVNALRRSHVGLKDSKRPLASLLFLGPTGTGKTELAKVIAKELFGADNLLLQFNMSEFMEQHSVSKLIGSPPGYVGYQEGGQLTEEIRRRPYSVVLFDEIEKAHPEVLNLLLQILEEGELKDGKGRKAHFQNTIVILTSNIGAEQIAKDSTLGFDVSPVDMDDKQMGAAFSDMRDDILEKLREEVRPEILNRLDDVLVFRGFNQEDCLEISQLMVNELISRLMENNILLNVDKSVVEFINKEGYSKEYGARNLRRKIQEVLENGLVNYILENDLKPPKRGKLEVEVKLGENNELEFTYKKSK